MWSFQRRREVGEMPEEIKETAEAKVRMENRNIYGDLSMHSCLVLAHELFEVAETSNLRIEDQTTAAILLLELLKGSQGGYTKKAFGGFLKPPDDGRIQPTWTLPEVKLSGAQSDPNQPLDMPDRPEGAA